MVVLAGEEALVAVSVRIDTSTQMEAISSIEATTTSLSHTRETMTEMAGTESLVGVGASEEATVNLAESLGIVGAVEEDSAGVVAVGAVGALEPAVGEAASIAAIETADKITANRLTKTSHKETSTLGKTRVALRCTQITTKRLPSKHERIRMTDRIRAISSKIKRSHSRRMKSFRKIRRSKDLTRSKSKPKGQFRAIVLKIKCHKTASDQPPTIQRNVTRMMF